MTLPPRRTAQFINAVAFLLIVWAAFPPSHFYAAMMFLLAISPWMAVRLKAQFPGAYRLEWRHKDPNPNISKFLVIPGLVLLVRAYVDYNILSGAALAVVIALIWCVMNIAIYKADSVNEPASLFTASRVLLALLMLPYCYGAAVQADVLMDIWPAQQYKVAVLDKYDWGNRWSVKVEPWEGVHGVKHMYVPQALYEAVNNGELVCVRQHVGAVFITWYDVARCDEKL